jgi:hypothetical protein
MVLRTGKVKKQPQDPGTNCGTWAPSKDEFMDRPHWADTVIAVFTVLIFLTYITSDYFLWKQSRFADQTLREVRSGGADTHELAVQAKNQAERTKEVADRTLAQADATNALAREAKRQADIARDALNLEGRPWVGISGNDSFRLQLVKGEPLKIVLIPKNFGTAPALRERSVNKMEEFPSLPPGRVPNFNAYTRAEAGPPIVLFPGSAAQINIDTSKSGAQGNMVFAHLTDEEIRQIRTGAIRIYLYGSIWYEDTFSKKHRTDYCFMYHPETSNEDTASFTACSEHNSAD